LPHTGHVKFPVGSLAGVLNYRKNSSEPAAVKTPRPIPSEDEHRVLIFRPRTPLHPPGQSNERGQQPRRKGVEHEQEPQVANDLTRYERDRDEPDDFRHRMLANVAGFAFTVALTAIGIWLAMSIADLRKTQDCVQMGRRDCAGIFVPKN
jgi:hypothetical protein